MFICFCFILNYSSLQKYIQFVLARLIDNGTFINDVIFNIRDVDDRRRLLFNVLKSNSYQKAR